jgi:hypothetical protein
MGRQFLGCVTGFARAQDRRDASVTHGDVTRDDTLTRQHRLAAPDYQIVSLRHQISPKPARDK